MTMMNNPEILFCVSALNEKEGFSFGVLVLLLGISEIILVLGVGVTVVFLCEGVVCVCFTLGAFMCCVGFCMTVFGVRFEPLSAHAVKSNVKNSRVVIVLIIMKVFLNVY